MTSSPLDSTHGRQHRVWHDITTVGEHTRSDDVEHGITSLPLESTHGQTTSGVACHHRLWAAHTVEHCRAWLDITALVLHTWSNDIGRGISSAHLDGTHDRQRRAWHDIIALGQHTRSAMSCVVCNHRPWTAHTVGRCRVWHDITTLGHYTWSKDFECGMTSPPLDSTHGQTRPGVACHHRPWTTHKVGRRQAWNDITALGQHK